MLYAVQELLKRLAHLLCRLLDSKSLQAMDRDWPPAKGRLGSCQTAMPNSDLNERDDKYLKGTGVDWEGRRRTDQILGTGTGRIKCKNLQTV